MTALYRRLLGDRFDELPDQVRALHDVSAPATWTGRTDVWRGGNAISRALATMLGLPPEGRDQPLNVTFTPRGDTEIWQRVFGAKIFRSTQWADGPQLRERVGPVVLHMTLQLDHGGLGLTLVGVSVLGIPLPAFVLPRISTRESERDGRYLFEVEAVMPLLGRLVRYEGVLECAAR
jgi:hypothetical protein